MKANKIFSIDIELLEKLKQEPNQSALVNKLLDDHYSLDRIMKMPREKIEELYQALKQKEELEAKIKVLENG